MPANADALQPFTTSLRAVTVHPHLRHEASDSSVTRAEPHRHALHHAAAMQHAVCAALGLGGVPRTRKPQALHAFAPGVGDLLSTHSLIECSRGLWHRRCRGVHGAAARERPGRAADGPRGGGMPLEPHPLPLPLPLPFLSSRNIASTSSSSRACSSASAGVENRKCVTGSKRLLGSWGPTPSENRNGTNSFVLLIPNVCTGGKPQIRFLVYLAMTSSEACVQPIGYQPAM